MYICTWELNICASAHMVSDIGLFEHLKPHNGIVTVVSWNILRSQGYVMNADDDKMTVSHHKNPVFMAEFKGQHPFVVENKTNCSLITSRLSSLESPGIAQIEHTHNAPKEPMSTSLI